MATTIPTVTGFAPIYGLTANAYTMQNGRNSLEYRASISLGKPGLAGTRRALRALLGVAPGASKAETAYRISPIAPLTGVGNGGSGGVRVVDAVPIGTGVTTAADVTYLNQFLIDRTFTMHPAIASYPVDASGNGGGGKVTR